MSGFTLSDEHKARFRERQKQVELARQRGQSHVGASPPARQQAGADDSQPAKAQDKSQQKSLAVVPEKREPVVAERKPDSSAADTAAKSGTQN